MGFFTKSKPADFHQFINSIKNNNNNILQVLGLKESSFTEMPYSMILDNPRDIAAGVTRVQGLIHKVHFSLFDNLLVKHHDDGEVRYMFYTTTHDPSKVLEIVDVLQQESESSTYDDNRFHSFYERDLVIQLANSPAGTLNKDIVQVYRFVDYICVLYYNADPHCQFLFSISRIVPKPLDYSVKRKGTVLNLLHIDIPALLVTPEEQKELNIENGKIKSIDYTYNLNQPELGVFDTAKIRIFNEEKLYHHSVQTHLFLSSSQKPSLAKISDASNKIIRMYSGDDIGSEELTITELEGIERDNYWVGRDWQLNNIHALANIKAEPSIYDVRLSCNDTEGFNLAILSYNRLQEYFGEN